MYALLTAGDGVDVWFFRESLFPSSGLRRVPGSGGEFSGGGVAPSHFPGGARG